MTSLFLSELAQTLGSAVLTGEAVSAKYRTDMSLSGAALPLAVIRPRTTEEVSNALRICHAHGIGVVPQGGLTGLAGGANPGADQAVISLELMRGVEEIDVASATMTVKAGTPLEVAQQAAADAGMFLGLDLGARGSCQIGGNLATNAGGIRVIRYGMAREQVLGLEAVLAEGTVISSMNKMLKNNAGYDLKHLFIGSEGTLGIITRAVLRLHPPPGNLKTALCALSSYEDVVKLLRTAQATIGNIAAFEALWRDYHAYTSTALKLQFFEDPHPFWVIIESADDMEEFLGGALESGLIADCIIATSEAQARDMWSVREGLAIDDLPNIINFDVSLPIAAIGDFAAACTSALKSRWPTVHVFCYGHIGDSNLHISVSTQYGPGEDMHTVDDIVYGALKPFNGSISAEHGIGTLKRPYLAQSRSPAELSLMRTLKKALDPKGILNPGKVIPAE
jgi:FAD/FMN-containing dehydrogenase